MKGQDQKPYKYGRKASVVNTLNSHIIVGATVLGIYNSRCHIKY